MITKIKSNILLILLILWLISLVSLWLTILISKNNINNIKNKEKYIIIVIPPYSKPTVTYKSQIKE